MSTPRVGVLALQGAYAAHQLRLRQLGVEACAVRTPEQLNGIDGLIMPGGESTTMSMLLESSGLFDPIAEQLDAGMPVFGTCAGMILCAVEVLDGRSDQRSFTTCDITVRRNGYGRQLDSFEADLTISGGDLFHAVFIRAPVVERAGDDVEVLARHDGVPVLLRQGRTMLASFHPELTDDTRVHAMFVQSI